MNKVLTRIRYKGLIWVMFSVVWELLALINPVFSQEYPYKDSTLPVNVRVKNLLQLMTHDEKFRQLFMVTGDLGNDSSRFKSGIFGFQLNTTAQQENAANQIMSYNSEQNVKETVRKANAMQRYFMEQTRLGIPVIFYDEALHGLVRSGATAFPQSIALAATFDTVLMNKVADAIASECKARGIRQVLSPVVNLATDVRWGRVEETYGEDPLLASCMGVSFVKAFEQIGIITTPKHFVLNHGDGGRDSYPVNINERYLEQTCFIPFKAVLKAGRAGSIMTAYNSLDGRPCTANNWLLNEKLKKEWGFRGFVVSDAGATGGANVLHFTASGYEDAGKQSIENGLDVIFQTDFDSYKLFYKPFLNGSVNAAAVDSAVTRVLRAKFELGLFDKPYIEDPGIEDPDTIDPIMKGDSTPEQAMGPLSPAGLSIDHRKLAKEASLKSIVLLKNDERRVLPLAAEAGDIALIGTDAVEARLGGYSGPGNHPVSILEGIRLIYGDKASVYYAEGCGRKVTEWVPVEPLYLSHDVETGETDRVKIPGKSGKSIKREQSEQSDKKDRSDGLERLKGLTAEYFNNIEWKGKPVLTRIDESINFQWTLFSPDPVVNYDFFSVRWSGYITSPSTGSYKVGIAGNDGYRLFIDDKLILDTRYGQSYHVTMADYNFIKDKRYKIRIEYKESSGNSWFRLVWNVGLVNDAEKKIQDAMQLAKNCDVVLVAVGIEEGEFRDRSHLELPGLQEQMILQLASLGKPIAVILAGGSAVIMNNWIDQVNAIVDVWYPGEAGGEAIAEILTGKCNPSGKLPITFPMADGQLPLIYNHMPTGRGDDYADGTGQAAFPFGFGLSYTQFEYSDLVFNKMQANSTDTILVSFNLKNAGSRDGEEVVQLYLWDELSDFARPVRELKGFQRVSLKAGEQKKVTFMLSPTVFTTLNEHLESIIEPGFFRMMIGSSSKDIRLRERIEIK